MMDEVTWKCLITGKKLNFVSQCKSEHEVWNRNGPRHLLNEAADVIECEQAGCVMCDCDVCAVMALSLGAIKGKLIRPAGCAHSCSQLNMHRGSQENMWWVFCQREFDLSSIHLLKLTWNHICEHVMSVCCLGFSFFETSAYWQILKNVRLGIYTINYIIIKKQ